ncbi:MAG: hypothetical protein DVS81_01855 [Candidatus Accumulibacter meliphilus]|jgi:hypothetical protein|uniref:Uncharacterized protein n=1 Tax=Candidatus Accumulibacter meliphilus TaxID=2211374 RepID=A0A369XYT8_9PROT|nr:MAG: hypothetical protein DVS81_01855 [Candidatus Accumulibacter meliphilus]
MKDMENFSRLVRKTRKENLPLLERYVARCDQQTSKSIDWSQPIDKVRESIVAAMGAVIGQTRKKLEDRAERIYLMAKQSGHEAVRSLGKGLEFPGKEDLPDGMARMLWLYLEKNDAFVYAEEARYAIEHRLSPKTYSAFSGPRDLALTVTDASKQQFASKIAGLMNVEPNEIAISDFTRSGYSVQSDDGEEETEQVTLYQFSAAVNTEANSFETVRNGQVETGYFVPCNKIRLTYEPASGAIEVYAPSIGMRRDIARAFADTIMMHEFTSETIPLEDYDLESFKKPRAFPANGENIGAIRVTQIKVERRHEVGGGDNSTKKAAYNALDIRLHRNEPRSIWAVAQDDFNISDLTPYEVKQVRIVIGIPKQVERRAHGLSVLITTPNGCSNGNMSGEERELRDRLLRHWQIVNVF